MYEQFPEFYAFVQRELVKVNPSLSSLLVKPLERSPLISMLAHIQDHGDSYFPEGQEIKHPSGAKKRIEGIMVSSARPKEVEVEYSAHIAGTPDKVGGDTPWTKARTFVGTTGETRALEGVAFRLGSDKPIRQTIKYQVEINVEEWTNVCSDGECCGTKGQGKPVTGLKVWMEDLP